MVETNILFTRSRHLAQITHQTRYLTWHNKSKQIQHGESNRVPELKCQWVKSTVSSIDSWSVQNRTKTLVQQMSVVPDHPHWWRTTTQSHFFYCFSKWSLWCWSSREMYEHWMYELLIDWKISAAAIRSVQSCDPFIGAGKASAPPHK